jgi:hypothetical protein
LSDDGEEEEVEEEVEEEEGLTLVLLSEAEALIKSIGR